VRALHLIVPGDLNTATGGYGYDRRIAAGLRALGWRVEVHALDASFPHPTPAAMEQARGVFAGLRERALVLVDGLALGAMPEVVRAHSGRLALIALIHHPLAAESGLEPRVARALERSERLALQAVRHVIVTSHATKKALLAYDVVGERLSVVEPGTDAAPLARGKCDGVLRMLCVAAVTPRKGHDVLIDALVPLARHSWHLTCAGSVARSPATVERLHAQLRDAGLAGRVTFTGEVDEGQLATLFRHADLFVLPTRFEGFGMAVAEALAHGLPVIGTVTGAIPELVGAKAGLLVPPGDVPALRAALQRALEEPALLAELAAGAALARDALPRWPQACERMSSVLVGVAGG
jgi:glycosyltransferase involved in cell wall biosynthesis